MSNLPTLRKHVRMTSVAAEVIKMVRIPGKDYARIKVRWWKLTHGVPMYCMEISQWLTDATIQGSKRQREKYPLSKWRDDWEILW